MKWHWTCILICLYIKSPYMVVHKNYWLQYILNWYTFSKILGKSSKQHDKTKKCTSSNKIYPQKSLKTNNFVKSMYIEFQTNWSFFNTVKYCDTVLHLKEIFGKTYCMFHMLECEYWAILEHIWCSTVS